MGKRRTAAKGTTKTSLVAGEAAEQTRAVYGEKFIPLILCAAGVLAYSNSLHAPFVFDDRFHIADNALVHQFWPWQILTHSSRPIVQLSLAWNYMLGGLDPWGYHVFNMVVHILAALVLYGVVGRTLSSSLLKAKFGRSAHWLAGLVAAIWLLHPIETQAVTYIVQRGESLMGLFYLLTLYCVIRHSESGRSRQADWWKAAAVVSCLVGMACKGGMTTAPIVVLLYDRAFLSRSWSGLMRRKGLYLGLAATWLVYPLVLANSPAEWKDTAGFGYTGVSWLQYARTQPAVILHYLRLTVWPDSLCLDYAWPVARTAGEIVPQSLVILGLLSATIWAWRRSPAIGFLGVWFFLILAPSSSFIPIADLAFEHRMYLSSAAVITLGVVGLYLLGQRFSGAGNVKLRVFGWVAASLVVATMASLTIG